MANINKIKLSGTTYNIQDLNAPKTVELTQAQYDALSVKDPNTFYIITDAQGADLSQYYTSAQTESAITQAVSGKQDTLISGTNIKTINNESILGSGNINIQGGGGSSYTAGDGIDITNDVISVTGKADTSAVTAIQDSLSGYVETSAVTSAVTSGSTDAITSGGVYDQLGGMKIVKLTESEYTVLVTKDDDTLYCVVPDPSN